MAGSFDQYVSLLREHFPNVAMNLELEDEDALWDLIGTFQPEDQAGRTDPTATGANAFNFPAGYEAGAPVLSLLVFGIVFFSLLFINATIISGSGRPAHSFLIGLGTWIVDVALNCALIPRYGMMGAALSTTLAMLLGLVVSAIYVRRRFGTVSNPRGCGARKTSARSPERASWSASTRRP